MKVTANINTKYDICFNRHRDNSNSNQANLLLTPHKQGVKAQILAMLQNYREGGLTGLELSAMLCKPFNAISGRLSELKKEHKIREDGSKSGCAVLFIND